VAQGQPLEQRRRGNPGQNRQRRDEKWRGRAAPQGRRRGHGGRAVFGAAPARGQQGGAAGQQQRGQDRLGFDAVDPAQRQIERHLEIRHQAEGQHRGPCQPSEGQIGRQPGEETGQHRDHEGAGDGRQQRVLGQECIDHRGSRPVRKGRQLLHALLGPCRTRSNPSRPD
jgi:hypothetical protein